MSDVWGDLVLVGMAVVMVGCLVVAFKERRCPCKKCPGAEMIETCQPDCRVFAEWKRLYR